MPPVQTHGMQSGRPIEWFPPVHSTTPYDRTATPVWISPRPLPRTAAHLAAAVPRSSPAPRNRSQPRENFFFRRFRFPRSSSRGCIIIATLHNERHLKNRWGNCERACGTASAFKARRSWKGLLNSPPDKRARSNPYSPNACGLARRESPARGSRGARRGRAA
ncbi:MAG: hypothetical protein JWL59_2164 [Chthoniobacteraceae bacterium]|nr:hypothetical protein [Chthoniobacteraceae bacterium]